MRVYWASRFFLFLAVILASSLSAVETIKRFDTINATQLLLKNGMTVWLKPTDCETGEIYVKLAALGGFASLEEKDRPSAELAAQVAWESGMDTMSSDQISVFLYENSLDFFSKIYPFSRVIHSEGAVSGIDSLLQYIKMVFTRLKFTKQGWQAALSSARNDLDKRVNDVDFAYETAFTQFNTRELSSLRSLTPKDLGNTDFVTSEKIFHQSFSDPSEFVCVIVGDFDVNKMIALIGESLGSIPRQNPGASLNRPFSAPFPEGISNGTVKLKGHSGNIVRLTFPIKTVMNEQILPEIAFASQVIETRLRQVITDKMNLSYGVDVSYEFPVYPLLADPWISIRFRSPEQQVQTLTTIILGELKRLQSEGVAEEEVETMKKLEFSHQEFWLQDNFYWVSMLTNYCLWGWNPEKIIYKNTSINDLTAQKTSLLIKQAISLDNYGVFSGIFIDSKL